MLPEVLDTMLQSLQEVYGNPSSIHAQGRKARVEIERARRIIAKGLNAQTSEIFFTSGGTEANNAILWGCVKDLKRSHFVSSALEHPAVLATLDALVKYQDIRVSLVDTDSQGHVDLDHLAFLLQQNPQSVVSLMQANNEIGTLLPVKDVAALCRRYDALFHSDTVQTIGKFKMDMQVLDLDFAVASAHKFHGPKGIGFMYVKSTSYFRPFIHGGAQERNMRAGTENTAGIVAMAKAFDMAQKQMDLRQKHIQELKQYAIAQLLSHIPGIGFHGDAHHHSLYTILNISLPERFPGEMLPVLLDMQGVAVSGGSACASGANKGSHVLTALKSPPERPAVRLSFSVLNTRSEVDQFVSILSAVDTPDANE